MNASIVVSVSPNARSMHAEYAAAWPNVTIKREPAADFREFIGVPKKFDKYFSRNPGQGD
jgi:ferredoxin